MLFFEKVSLISIHCLILRDGLDLDIEVHCGMVARVSSVGVCIESACTISKLISFSLTVDPK
jgi:hypothetical protein